MRISSFILFIVSIAFFLHCGSETEGGLVSFNIVFDPVETSLVADDQSKLTISLATINLKEMTIHENIHLAAAEKSFVREAFDAFYDWIIPSADAHPGHSAEGDTLASYSGIKKVDLLQGDQNFGLLEGVSGNIAFGRFVFSSEQGGAIEISVTIKRDDCQKSFSLTIALDEELAEIPIDSDDSESMRSGALKIKVDLYQWLGRIDFAELCAQSTTETLTIDEDSQAYNALVRGIKTKDAYQLRMVP